MKAEKYSLKRRGPFTKLSETPITPIVDYNFGGSLLQYKIGDWASKVQKSL